MKVPRDAVTDGEWRALETGVVVHARTTEARFVVTGKGALPCLQGLVTSDLNAAPDGTRLFGALLTSKGMIVATLYVARRSAERLGVEAPGGVSAQLEDLFAKSLPPRLCAWERAATTGLGAYGPRAGAVASAIPGALPAVARGVPGYDGEVPAGAADGAIAAMVAAGAVRASDALLQSCRILAGIPSLGDEIHAKTLPQEVRLEELGAISYTKGCYLGQETVARLHFRGHANRRLALLILDAEPGEPPLDVRAGDQPVGRLTSTCWSPELDAWVAQAILRREIEDGAEVEAAGVKAVVRVDRWLRDP